MSFAPRPPELTVYVIGSPSEGQKYQYQFVSAADCLPKDEYTIWLVEKTGYEIYGVTIDYITQLAPPGGLGWITPTEPLVGWLNSFKDGLIKNLAVFSHGVRGMIALRYGWDQDLSPDYGLTVDQVKQIDRKKFAPNPTIRFDSCNSGVAFAGAFGGESIARAMADHLQTAVGGWTGRTSYADVNSGKKCAVRGSGQTKNPFSTETWKELESRYWGGGSPKFRLFQPAAK